MRMRNKPGAEDELRENPLVIYGPEKEKEPKGQWQNFFGNKKPIHLEIGTGRGKFITGMAEKFSNINFVAMEPVEEVLIFPTRYALEHDLDNLRFIYGRGEYLEEYFGPQEISCIYINFCDPWPKKRHHKRRLTHRRFLNRYKKFLKPGGEVHFKTDNRTLFEFSLEELSTQGFLLKNITFKLHQSKFAEKNIITGYEEKWRKQGINICRLEARWTGQ